MQLNEAKKEFYTTNDLALLLGLSRTVIYRLISARKIKFAKIGHSIRFHKNDILEFLEKNTTKAIS
jgi:excisionase family DNA binding protein